MRTRTLYKIADGGFIVTQDRTTGHWINLYNPLTDDYTRLVRYHRTEACEHRQWCDVHDRRDPASIDKPLVWQSDTLGGMAYACEHSVLHPTVSQVNYWFESENLGQLSRHTNCDGCCAVAW